MFLFLDNKRNLFINIFLWILVCLVLVLTGVLQSENTLLVSALYSPDELNELIILTRYIMAFFNFFTPIITWLFTSFIILHFVPLIDENEELQRSSTFLVNGLSMSIFLIASFINYLLLKDMLATEIISKVTKLEDIKLYKYMRVINYSANILYYLCNIIVFSLKRRFSAKNVMKFSLIFLILFLLFCIIIPRLKI